MFLTVSRKISSELFVTKFITHLFLYFAGKQQLLEYIDTKPGRYNYKLLKTKIMNEQNKKKIISKKRMNSFLGK